MNVHPFVSAPRRAGRLTMTKNQNRRRPFAVPLSTKLSDVVLAGQRLRANEAVSPTTFALAFAARRTATR